MPSGSERRELLLDVTMALVLEAGAGAVSMGSVAERAEVTRALVYKHFSNKDELLTALFQREAAKVDREIRGQIALAGEGFESKLRAYVHAVVEGVTDAAPFIDPLRAAAADAGFGRTQRGWDKGTVKWFAGLAARDLGLEERTARSAMSMLLGGVRPLLDQARAAPGEVRRAALEERYVAMVLGALHALAEDRT